MDVEEFSVAGGGQGDGDGEADEQAVQGGSGLQVLPADAEEKGRDQLYEQIEFSVE